MGRRTGGFVDGGRLDLFWWLSAGDAFFDTADCGAVNYGERVHLGKTCCSCSGDPQCLGGVWYDAGDHGSNGRDSWACNGRETWSRPRASLGCAIIVAAAVVCRRRDGIAIPAWRTQRGRPGVEGGRVDFAFERNTPSTTNGGGSKRLSCVNPEREEQKRDEWLVPDRCGNGHRDPDGCQEDHLGFRFQMTAVSRRRPTRMLRGDVK